MTPDAVLRRYAELVFDQPIDIDALWRVVSTDADLLGRWVASLGVRADPRAIRGAIASLRGEELQRLAQAQIWSVAPFGAAARLGFDQWRAVLRAACLAETLAGRVHYAEGEAVRLRTLLAISGIGVADDPLMGELFAFRGAGADELIDAHPLLRLFAVVEALEHHGRDAAAGLCERLLGIGAAGLEALLGEAEQAAQALIAAAGISEEAGGDWRERLGLQAQVGAFSNLIAVQRSIEEIDAVAGLVSRALFGQLPGCFLLDAERGVLNALGGDELAALSISAMHPSSIIARALREREPVEAEDSGMLPVADRQVMRRLAAERVCAVPMLCNEHRVGVLVFRLSDEDRGEADWLMRSFAAELGRWLREREREQTLRRSLLEDYRRRQERRLREIVHEANNALSTIRNYLQSLELRLQEQPAIREQLPMIAEEIRRTGSIIAASLDMPGPSAEPSPRPEPGARRFDLNEVAHNAAELMRGAAERQGVAIHEALFGEGVFVSSDADLVMQITTNLVRNAVEALGEGGTVVIETASRVYRQGRAGVELIIRDDGPGIPDAVLARLYEPKQSSKGGDHAGLGLHITAQLVEALQGAIDVRTSPGRGTAFSVFLPDLAG